MIIGAATGAGIGATADGTRRVGQTAAGLAEDAGEHVRDWAGTARGLAQRWLNRHRSSGHGSGELP
jgi:hypothetical protein